MDRDAKGSNVRVVAPGVSGAELPRVGGSPQNVKRSEAARAAWRRRMARGTSAEAVAKVVGMVAGGKVDWAAVLEGLEAERTMLGALIEYVRARAAGCERARGDDGSG